MPNNNNNKQRTTNKITAGGPPQPRNLNRRGNATQARRLPKANIGKLKDEHIIDEAVVRWSKLVSDPFNANPRGVYMPLAEDMFPCDATSMENYSTFTLEVGAGRELQIYPFPDPPRTNGEDSQHYRLASPLSGADSIPGIPLDTIVAGQQVPGWAFGYRIVSAGASMPLFVNSQSLNAVPYDKLSIPTVISDTTSSAALETFRTMAYGVRVTFISKLMDTEGWVEAATPYEYPGTPNGGGGTLGQLRKDPSWRRHFFGDKREFTFTWHPNCDSVKYSSITAGTPGVEGLITRLPVRVGGLGDGDQVMIEIVHHMQLTSPTFGFINIPNPVTPDFVHVQNAIADNHGAQNRDSAGRKRDLHQAAMVQKIAKHPHLKHVISKLGAAATKGVAAGGLFMGGKALLSAAGEAIAELPALLAANPELLVPLLL